MKILSKWMIWWNEKKGKKEQWIVLFIIGLLLVVIAMPSENIASRKKQSDQTAEPDDPGIWSGINNVGELEQKLEQILGQADGVGKVSVMITLATSTERIVEKETQNQSAVSRENDTTVTETKDTSETVVYSDENGISTPYVKQEICPRIQGVLVVAEGGDNAVVVQHITEVVQALFDVDTHKIRVMKHN